MAMAKDGGKKRARMRRGMAWRMIAALILFGAGYAVANRFQLVHSVAYRLAADDRASAVTAFLFLSLQALVLAAALLLLPRHWAAALLALAGVSIFASLSYGQIVRELIDGGILAWMLGEARLAGAAAGEFGGDILSVVGQLVGALLLLVAARRVARGAAVMPWSPGIAAATLAALVTPSILYRHLELWPEGAERVLYGAAWEVAAAPPPPPRAAPTLSPDRAAAVPRHIVWLIDESVAAAPFARIVKPRLANIAHRDFGVAAALGHCSAPAQIALRSGVDVRRAGPTTDLRRTPSIWGYARRAGYRTVMIDGQTSGAPQNMMLPPERALIDMFAAMPGGIDTDLRIADRLNAAMRGPGKSFTIAVLRGVHFQYRDHYPPGAIPADSPVAVQYDMALKWSKARFFERLLAGVDRGAVAVVYTSDHGQNLAPGALPHCSRDAVADEFRVPLIAFLPPALAARYADAPARGHSVSQIFPATLGWMGYDPARAAALYDADLTAPTARYVWFDRNAVPLRAGGTIGITAGPDFPGTSAARKTGPN